MNELETERDGDKVAAVAPLIGIEQDQSSKTQRQTEWGLRAKIRCGSAFPIEAAATASPICEPEEPDQVSSGKPIARTGRGNGSGSGASRGSGAREPVSWLQHRHTPAETTMNANSVPILTGQRRFRYPKWRGCDHKARDRCSRAANGGKMHRRKRAAAASRDAGTRCAWP
jgi:hypothetical protein